MYYYFVKAPPAQLFISLNVVFSLKMLHTLQLRSFLHCCSFFQYALSVKILGLSLTVYDLLFVQHLEVKLNK